MKTILVVFFSLFLFAFSLKESTEKPGMKNEIISTGIEKPLSEDLNLPDDIYVSFDYLTDATGYKYGAVFYLYNPNDFVVSIQWQFVGYSNVNFSPANSDRTTIPAKTKIWITNVTSADHSKAWSSGKVQWKY
jgi:hypothetical protein